MGETKHTPGPWLWKVDLNSRQITLQSEGNMRQIVMDFVRWSNGGAPRLNKNGLMERGDAFATIVEGREHHASWFQSLDHPDAQLIAAAPTIYKALSEIVDSLEHGEEVSLSKARAALKAAEGESK